MTLPRAALTGLVLAGGQGRRMGGVDKGLQPFHGRPLARHALERLAPQVGTCLVSANRNAAAYAAFGVPVLADAGHAGSGHASQVDDAGQSDQAGAAGHAGGANQADHAGHAGPLAGMLAGLRACRTDWLLTVPCDSPAFPTDLADRLAAAVVAAGADIAMAATHEDGRPQPQPVFCLVHRRLADDLAAWLAGGGASPRQWAARHALVMVTFDDPAAFANANTADDLARLEADALPRAPSGPAFGATS